MRGNRGHQGQTRAIAANRIRGGPRAGLYEQIWARGAGASPQRTSSSNPCLRIFSLKNRAMAVPSSSPSGPTAKSVEEQIDGKMGEHGILSFSPAQISGARHTENRGLPRQHGDRRARHVHLLPHRRAQPAIGSPPGRPCTAHNGPAGRAY